MKKRFSESNLERRKLRRRRLEEVNILQEMLLELMNDRKIQMVDIHKATGIPFATLQNWIQRESKTQYLDGNILALSKYFGVSINYLAFGIGEDPERDSVA